MRLRRCVWKREPTEQEIVDCFNATMFGPLVVVRGNEWLVLYDDPKMPWHLPDVPEGFTRLEP